MAVRMTLRELIASYESTSEVLDMEIFIPKSSTVFSLEDYAPLANEDMVVFNSLTGKRAIFFGTRKE